MWNQLKQTSLFVMPYNSHSQHASMKFILKSCHPIHTNVFCIQDKLSNDKSACKASSSITSTLLGALSAL